MMVHSSPTSPATVDTQIDTQSLHTSSPNNATISSSEADPTIALDPQFLTDLKSLFPFSLDLFQQQAMGSLHQGRSVVVCAPTGSGKTLIAEFAALYALEKGKKLFYTTPLKALSNQKYFDFRARFGEQNVGLLTGDLSVNRDARLLVMTTEIFRNMLYELGDNVSLLDNVGYVVLDECHFMNDADRGTVWEESIIYCPRNVQLIALSATVANAEVLTDWIRDVHGPTDLIQSDYRPVPLRHFYFGRKKVITPLFEQGSHHIMNRQLKSEQTGLGTVGKDAKGRGKRFTYHPPSLVEGLLEKDMLPAILFTFSRKRCDEGVQQVLNHMQVGLLTPDEAATSARLIDEHLEQHPFLANEWLIDGIRKGVASHHAGLLPAMKMLVERLFQENLLKVVFATETLAAGVNMPARTTVITSLSKRSDDGHRVLHASEFLQMAGRAGRRGLDNVGYVVSVGGSDTGSGDAARLASSDPDPLVSRFTPTYGMALNLLQRHTLERVESLIRESFGQFTIKRESATVLTEIESQRAHLDTLMHYACPAELTEADFQHYLALKDQTHRLTKQITHAKKHHEPESVIAALEAEKAPLLAQQQAMACYECKVFGEHRGLGDRLERHKKKIRKLENQYQKQINLYWRHFLNLFHLLQEMGYVDENNKPQGKGLIAAQIRTENEVFMTEFLSAPFLQDVSPETLASLVASLVNEMNRNRGGETIQWSSDVRRLYRQMSNLAAKMHETQEKFEVTLPITTNPIGIGLVEAWAKGWDWDSVLTLTDLDPGDLVRMVRRTADILRQVSKLEPNEFITKPLIESARLGYSLINREPVKELEVFASEDTF